jgi:hypothetical protein
MRGIRWLLVVLLLAVLGVVIVDRVGAWAAQRAVAEQVAAELAANDVQSAPPEVSIDRVPFLHQVAAGRYHSVTVWLRDVQTGGVRLPTVELVATGVNATVDTLVSGDGPITAERIDGTATIGFGSVAELAGLPELSLSADQDGLLQVEAPAEVLGTELRLAGAAAVSVVDQAVRLSVESLRVTEPDGLPPGAEPLIEQLAAQLSVTIPLPPLPYGLVVEQVAVAPGGLVIAVSAEQVPLSR